MSKRTSKDHGMEQLVRLKVADKRAGAREQTKVLNSVERAADIGV
jgi:hypothetical protein